MIIIWCKTHIAIVNPQYSRYLIVHRAHCVVCGFGRQHDFCTEELLDNYLSRGNLGSNALGLCRTLDAALSMSVSEIVYLQYFHNQCSCGFQQMLNYLRAGHNYLDLKLSVRKLHQLPVKTAAMWPTALCPTLKLVPIDAGLEHTVIQ
jgi:hypothetical protein